MTKTPKTEPLDKNPIRFTENRKNENGVERPYSLAHGMFWDDMTDLQKHGY